MYCKLFASLYQGTLRGNAHGILVFTNLLAHADMYGRVDKHFRAIAEEVGLSIEQVQAAIAELEAPDSESRSPELEGRRIVRLDEHRVWGWHVVNYGKYRAIRNEDDRREQSRLAQERFRDKKRNADSKKSKPRSAEVSHGKPQKAQAEAEAKEEEIQNPPSIPPAGGKSSRQDGRRSTVMPEGFRPGATHEALAGELGVDLECEFAKFCDHHGARGTTFKRWDLALNTWLRNAQAYGQRPARVNGHGAAGESWQQRRTREAKEAAAGAAADLMGEE